MIKSKENREKEAIGHIEEVLSRNCLLFLLDK